MTNYLQKLIMALRQGTPNANNPMDDARRSAFGVQPSQATNQPFWASQSQQTAPQQQPNPYGANPQAYAGQPQSMMLNPRVRDPQGNGWGGGYDPNQ